MKQAWNYVIVEPFKWLFYCFFQPTKFRRDFEIKGFWKRIIPMLRLTLPIFLVSFFLVLLVALVPCRSFFNLDIGCYPDVFQVSPGEESWARFLVISKYILFNTFWMNILGIAVGILWGIVGNINWGIMWSLTLSFTLSSIGGSTYVFGFGSTYVFGFVGSLDLYMAYNRGILIAIIFGIIVGLIGGAEWSFVRSIVVGLIGGIAWEIAYIVAINQIFYRPSFFVLSPISQGISIAIAFIVSYLLGYYRLPFYIVSGLLGLRAFFACRKKPVEVFTCLHRSPLYWDENVFLPLPGLKSILLLAADQDIEQCLKEIAFIAAERPHQLGAAQAAALEIAIQDMEMRDNIIAIARASQRLTQILSEETRLVDPRWLAPIGRLKDASRDAARYCGPFELHIQRKALEDMLSNLERVNPHASLRDSNLSKRVSAVVTTWREVARNEQAKLAQKNEQNGYIDNPYNAGGVLESRDSLFVGRRDLVLQLRGTLSKGSRCPPFLLNGERRMGKSSTLKQLPTLLGGRYIPVVFDLQSRGLTSSTDSFLTNVAEKIYNEMKARGLGIKKLKAESLQKAGKRNEAAIYRLFDEWLKQIEHTLEIQDRTLLLLFDEFEKLDEVEVTQYLNLNLLLDWFRSVIQNYSRLPLLFSGVRTFGEMGTDTDVNWAGYFVNAQTLRVSFLQTAEARHLITQPVSNFPSERIFGEKVVEEIIHVTGSHPFLVQAVCWTLIEMLNAQKRNRTEIQDVATAISQVLEKWDSYFRDLWLRTDREQRMCLIALKEIGEGVSQDIQHWSSLNNKEVDHALQALCKRDLILLEHGKYRIATPIFCEWVKRYS